MGFELALSVALPEFDGNVITHPVSGKERTDDEAGMGSAPKHHFPIADRIDHATRLAVNWATLRHTPNEEKNVAVVLHNYPPSDDGIGTAFGLDSESTVNLLSELEARGYDLGGEMPEDGQTSSRNLPRNSPSRTGGSLPRTSEISVDVVSTAQYEDWFRRPTNGSRRISSGSGRGSGSAVRDPRNPIRQRPRHRPAPRGFGMDPRKSTTTPTSSRPTTTTRSTAGSGIRSRPTPSSTWVPTAASSGSPARRSVSTGKAHPTNWSTTSRTSTPTS